MVRSVRGDNLSYDQPQWVYSFPCSHLTGYLLTRTRRRALHQEAEAASEGNATGLRARYQSAYAGGGRRIWIREQQHHCRWEEGRRRPGSHGAQHLKGRSGHNAQQRERQRSETARRCQERRRYIGLGLGLRGVRLRGHAMVRQLSKPSDLDRSSITTWGEGSGAKPEKGHSKLCKTVKRRAERRAEKTADRAFDVPRVRPIPTATPRLKYCS